MPLSSGFSPITSHPAPGSAEEIEAFNMLQAGFAAQFETAFPDKLADKTVVIIPSFSLDQEILAKVAGVVYYEERLLCLLMLLRMPRTQVIFVSSMPIDPVIVDYYLHLLPGITSYHARQRLVLLSCYDSSPRPLSEKILERPRLMQRILQNIPNHNLSHLAFFNVTSLERTLAVRLGMPLYGCDPELFVLGNKSNSRRVFRDCGLMLPDGREDIKTRQEIAEALLYLKQRNPRIRKAVIKLNDGFSGDGNAIFYYPTEPGRELQVADFFDSLPSHTTMVASDLRFETFLEKLEDMGGVVEAFVEGDIKESPSVQCMVTPLGKCEVVSTHDQQLGGESGQVFLGAHFPAKKEYAVSLAGQCTEVMHKFREAGVLGRFAIDFISVKNGDSWQHYAIEINLRKGGTTHPLLMLSFLTDGHYDAASGEYTTATGQPRYYFCSDNLHSKQYRGLTPHDLIEIAMVNELQYDGSSQEGIMFHLIGALSEFGKLGVVCIGATPERAWSYYEKICQVLEWECKV